MNRYSARLFANVNNLGLSRRAEGINSMNKYYDQSIILIFTSTVRIREQEFLF